MTIKLRKEDIERVMNQLADVFSQQKDFLNELDSKIGDGDHGLSMSRGFNAIVEYYKKNPDLNISDMLSCGGMQFNEATGSTIGILIFSAMRSAGLAVKGKSEILFNDLIKMLEGSIEAIQKIGKAQKGQKTILDTLIPVISFLESQKGNIGQLGIIKESIKIAYESAENTKDMEPQVGRARWFKERGVGVLDPGAYTGYLIIKTVGEYLSSIF
jgi:dihydroxyacetone kinase-like protein